MWAALPATGEEKGPGDASFSLEGWNLLCGVEEELGKKPEIHREEEGSRMEECESVPGAAGEGGALCKVKPSPSGEQQVVLAGAGDLRPRPGPRPSQEETQGTMATSSFLQEPGNL